MDIILLFMCFGRQNVFFWYFRYDKIIILIKFLMKIRHLCAAYDRTRLITHKKKPVYIKSVLGFEQILSLTMLYFRNYLSCDSRRLQLTMKNTRKQRGRKTSRLEEEHLPPMNLYACKRSQHIPLITLWYSLHNAVCSCSPRWFTPWEHRPCDSIIIFFKIKTWLTDEPLRASQLICAFGEI